MPTGSIIKKGNVAFLQLELTGSNGINKQGIISHLPPSCWTSNSFYLNAIMNDTTSNLWQGCYIIIDKSDIRFSFSSNVNIIKLISMTSYIIS